mgnify:CR=1 FL=1
MGIEALTNLLEIGYRIIVMCAYNHQIFERGWRLLRKQSEELVKKNDLALLCSTDTRTSKTSATAARAKLQTENKNIIREIKFGNTDTDGYMGDEITKFIISNPENARTILVIVDPERVKPLASTLAKNAHHPEHSKIHRMSIRPCGAILIEKTGIRYIDAIRD